jgi:hypothetical protein
MTPEEIDLLQEELEEYLPTSLQSKLGKALDIIRNPPKKISNEILAGMNGLVILDVRKDTRSRTLDVTFTGMCKTVKAEELIQNLYHNNAPHPNGYTGRYYPTKELAEDLRIANMWDGFYDHPAEQANYHIKTTKKLDENQNKTGEEPDENYGLSA